MADMMTATTWMDATAARENGFVDAIAESAGSLTHAEGVRIVNRKDAEAKVQAWFDRHKPHMQRADKTSPTPDAGVVTAAGTPVAQLRRRLELIQPKDR